MSDLDDKSIIIEMLGDLILTLPGTQEQRHILKLPLEPACYLADILENWVHLQGPKALSATFFTQVEYDNLIQRVRHKLNYSIETLTNPDTLHVTFNFNILQVLAVSKIVASLVNILHENPDLQPFGTLSVEDLEPLNTILEQFKVTSMEVHKL